MTKKKHKVLPEETLNAFKYTIAAELGLLGTAYPDVAKAVPQGKSADSGEPRSSVRAQDRHR